MAVELEEPDRLRADGSVMNTQRRLQLRTAAVTGELALGHLQRRQRQQQPSLRQVCAFGDRHCAATEILMRKAISCRPLWSRPASGGGWCRRGCHVVSLASPRA